MLLLINGIESDVVEIVGINGNYKDKIVKRSICTKKLNETIDYLISDTKQAFTQLKQTFIKALIFQYFDPKCDIQIETHLSGYAIGGVLSQLTLDNLG